MTTEKSAARKPIGLDEAVLVGGFSKWAKPARILWRAEGASGGSLCVEYTDNEYPGGEPFTTVVDESRVFRYDEVDKYEPEDQPLLSHSYRRPLMRSVRRLIRHSRDGLGLHDMVGADAASILVDSSADFDIWTQGDYPQFRLVAWYTMRAEVSRYFEEYIVWRLSRLPASCVRLVVANEAFADTRYLDDNGVVWFTWRSRKDDRALANAIRLAVAQRQSAVAV